jgi:hypothetical protein
MNPQEAIDLGLTLTVLVGIFIVSVFSVNLLLALRRARQVRRGRETSPWVAMNDPQSWAVFCGRKLAYRMAAKIFHVRVEEKIQPESIHPASKKYRRFV